MPGEIESAPPSDEITVEERIRNIRMAIEEYELLEREIDKELENISGNTIDNKAV